MKITTRFAEYSITGGLFWLSLFLFATLLQLLIAGTHPTPSNAFMLWGVWLGALQPLATIMNGLPAELQSAIGTVLATLGVILIFLTGILLDLISPIFFTPIETHFFRKWLVNCNHSWLRPLLATHGEFVGEDFTQFASGRLFDWRHPLRCWFTQRHRYNKLRTFMLSYVLMFADSAGIDEFMDTVHLWHTSRALSGAMVTLAFLLNVTPLINYQAVEAQQVETVAMIAIGVPLLLVAISLIVTLGTYSRMCMTMCSLLYITAVKRGETAEQRS